MAFPNLKYNANATRNENKSRIECLMNFLQFDINQLLIYESQKKKCQKQELIQQLRSMKIKTEEVKFIVANNPSVLKAEEMLKRRSHLKCASRSFRRKLIEFMANVEPSESRSKIICSIMKQLDLTDVEIAGLCESVKNTHVALSADFHPESTLGGLKRRDCGDVKICGDSKEPRPAIFEEIVRPYDPSKDEDSQSIHLRYVPALDSFKSDMMRNPEALRLPLMCPPMKRIMNKMKTSYLMNDVPCKCMPD